MGCHCGTVLRRFDEVANGIVIVLQREYHRSEGREKLRRALKIDMETAGRQLDIGRQVFETAVPQRGGRNMGHDGCVAGGEIGPHAVEIVL